MKRKLNEANMPVEICAAATTFKETSFEDLGLEARLLQAVAKEKFSKPTPVQAQAIPLVLQGRDVVAHAKTGSGKTAAYVLPLLQAVLQRKAHQNGVRSTSALILIPTRELASQITKEITKFSAFCPRDIQTVNLATQIHEQAQKALLASTPDIVVATPARASIYLSSSQILADKLLHLVIDEADLILSYGYEEDLRTIVNLIPKGIQAFLASATLTSEVETLKGLFCRDTVILDLQADVKGSTDVSQYVVRCAEDEKFLLIFAVFKLKLIKGKCIVFVGDIDRCYRVKLFLEQFGVKSCVLNSELPVNSRVHVIEEFNKNVYDIIIATDEQEIASEVPAPEKKISKQQKKSNHSNDVGEEDGIAAESTVLDDHDPAIPIKTAAMRSKRPKSTAPSKKDREYGISRGIDFQLVACVLNFDLPTNPRSYTHRIGRTARANCTGIALSFAIPAHLYRKHKPTTFPTCQHDERTLKLINADQDTRGHNLEPYRFDMARLDGFRYRVSSAIQAISAGVVREARIRELRQEMLKSERLKRHLEENPEDLRYLRHDTELRPAKVLPHMRHVPDYLMPKGISEDDTHKLADVGFVGPRKESMNRIRNARAKNRLRSKGRSSGRKADPLKTFNARGRK